jgi:hypothetical protein
MSFPLITGFWSLASAISFKFNYKNSNTGNNAYSQRQTPTQRTYFSKRLTFIILFEYSNISKQKTLNQARWSKGIYCGYIRMIVLYLCWLVSVFLIIYESGEEPEFVSDKFGVNLGLDLS